MNTIDYKEKKNKIIRLLSDNDDILKYIGEKGMTIKGKYKDIATGKVGTYTSKISHEADNGEGLITFRFKINYDKSDRITERFNKVRIRSL